MERIIFYDVDVWGGNLINRVKDKLPSLKKMFLLERARGYKTHSTDALAVLTGIQLINLSLNYEYIKKENISH